MSITTLLANRAIVSAAYAGIAIAAVHLSNRDYDIISQPMSYYAVGASGFLMQTIILAYAASVIVLSLALERSVPGLSRVGLIHTTAIYLFSPCLVAGALLLSRRFDDVRLRHAPTFVLALASWLSLIVLIAVNLLNLQIGGIGQRIFLTAILLWLIVTAFRLPKKTLEN